MHNRIERSEVPEIVPLPIDWFISGYTYARLF